MLTEERSEARVHTFCISEEVVRTAILIADSPRDICCTAFPRCHET